MNKASKQGSLFSRFSGTEDSDKKIQWVTLGISFLLAVTLWFLVTLSTQSYQSVIELPVAIRNVPADVRLESSNPGFRVTTKGLGINILSEKYLTGRDTVSLDFQKDLGRNGKRLSVAFRDKLRDVVPLNLSVVRISPDTFTVPFKRLVSRKVAVENKVKLNLAPGYRLLEDPQLSPDSVKLIGPEEKIKGIRAWPTMNLETAPVNRETILKIPMDTSMGLRTEPGKVELYLNASLFTEKTAKISISGIRNAPSGSQIELFPQEVNITYLVPVKSAGKTGPEDFQAVVDYASKNPRSDKLLVEIIRKPNNTRITNIKPDLIGFYLIEE